MLRLSDPLLSSRLGGWAQIDSPPQRTASTDQHWSLAIAVAAALVAISAVIFDLRLPSDISLPTVSPTPSSVETTQRAAAEVAPLPTTTQPESSASAATDATARPASTAADNPQPTTATPASPSAAATAETTSAATSQTSLTNAAESSAETATAVVDDPASRIRDYLGLHAGAQLPVSFSYIVEPGDTASSIAKRFGLEEATVLFNNFDIYDPNQLSVDQRLTLPTVDGLVYTVQPGDILDSLLHNFQADLEATLAYPANGIASPDHIQVGQQILLVHGSASLPAVSSSSAASTGGGQTAQVWTVPEFVLYLRYDQITDYFGTARANSVGYHTGVDFNAPVGELVGAAAAGLVSVATWDPSYGNWVEIDHGGGYRSRYAHLDIINVREGQRVDAGNYIGTVGNTGNSSGAHLHFEIIINGQAVNPLAWLN